jgi:PBP1b-binding outer membrane lipoprotein LpoB
MPIFIALFFISCVSFVCVLNVPAKEAEVAKSIAKASSTSVLAYRAATINYLNANPGFQGKIPDAAISPVWGYVSDKRWSNVVSNGTLFVFEDIKKSTAVAPKAISTLSRVYEDSGKSSSVGRNKNGEMESADGLSTKIKVPDDVPEGALLIIGK